MTGARFMQAITVQSGNIAANIGTLDLVSMFLEALDASAATRETYRRALRAWTNYLSDIGISLLETTRQTILDYKRELLETKAPSSVNVYLTSVRQLFSWLESERIYPNVASGIKGLKKPKTASKDSLTIEQAKSILSSDPQTLEEKRNAAIVNLMIRRGLRGIEITRANVRDIRQVDGQAALFVHGKGHNEADELIVLTEPDLKALYTYLDARAEVYGQPQPSEPLFIGLGNRNAGGRLTTRTIRNIASQALEREGIKSARLTGHSMRHSSVTFALKGGASLQAAQALARHRSIETTMIYAHNLKRLEAEAELAIDRLLS